MEVRKCDMKVAMETIGEAQNLNTKSKMAESWFASSDEIVVDQLKLNAKNKNTTKSTQTWLNVWGKWANERKFNPGLEEYEHEDLDKLTNCFTLKYLPKMDSFIISLRILSIKDCMIAHAFRDIIGHS